MVNELIDFIKELEKLVSFFDSENIPYMIFGGIANSIYGHTRQTFDIDVKLILDSESERKNLIKKISSFSTVLPQNPVQFIQETNVLPVEIDDLRTDIVFAELPYEKDAVRRSTKKQVYGIQFNVCQPEDLIIQKAISVREKDWQDIHMIIKMNNKTLDWTYLLEHCKTLADFLANPQIVQRVLDYKNE
jgi:hypothetical protein